MCPDIKAGLLTGEQDPPPKQWGARGSPNTCGVFIDMIVCPLTPIFGGQAYFGQFPLGANEFGIPTIINVEIDVRCNGHVSFFVTIPASNVPG